MDAARRDELAVRHDELAEAHDSHGDDLPGDVAAELDAIERELDGLDACARAFRAEDVARAGASLTLAADGSLRVERGFMRPEDEAKPATPGGEESGEADGIGEMGTDADAGGVPGGAGVTPIRGGSEAEDTAPILSATLLAELEAHCSAGLQAAIAGQPGLALRVLLHGLATDAFYGRFGDTVAAFDAYPPALASACPGIGDSPARRAMTAAEDAWRARLPNEHGAWWD